MMALSAVSAFAAPYEMIEAKLPNEPDAPLIVQFLNNAGQIAGYENRAGGRSFLARWEPGKINLTEVRTFENSSWLALYENGEGLASEYSVRTLSPQQRHPISQRLYASKGVTRVLHYSGGAFRLVKEFETWGGAFPGYLTAFSESSDGKFVFSEYGGDDYNLRFPSGATGNSWNEQLPHHPEVWKLSDLSGRETLLNTGIGVLNQPGDYRYTTRFLGVDAKGFLYANAAFRTHPLTSFGRPYTGTRYEVWASGYPTRLADFAPPWGGSFATEQVNRDGEISGGYGTIGIFGGAVGGRAAIYLPRPNYGRPAGIQTLTTTNDPAVMHVTRLNRQGALVWGAGNLSQGRLWSGGVHTPLNSLVSTAATTQVLTGIRSIINDRGWIVTEGRNSDPSAAPDFRQWLLRPVADAEVFLSTNRVALGETFTFTLRVRNLTGTPRALGLPIGFRFTGSARFQLVGGATPTGPRTVPAFGSFDIQQQIRATNTGVSTWYSQGRLIGGGTTNDTAQAYSEPIHVVNYGDLLIKRATEPETLYSGNDIYEKSPSGTQMRLVSQGAGETNRFSLRVQNDAPQAASFVLRLAAGPNPADWRVVARDAASNVLSGALDAGGWATPELAPGATLDLSLEISDLSAEDQDQLTVAASLSNPGDAEAVDAVAAVVTREPVPVEIGLRRVLAGGYTAQSVQAGLADPDAPLELVADPATLAAQPWIHGGWVADGVTPLLLQLNSFPGALAFYPEGRSFRLELKIESGGGLAGRSLTDGLNLLREGNWAPTNGFTLTSAAPTVFATLPPVAADALQLSFARELVLSATVVDALTGRTVNQFKFRLRKPPVVLIHGYNTTGDWEDSFVLELSRSRPLPPDEPAWVRVARYGQATEPGRSPYVSQLVNTLWPLADLVPLAEAAFEEAVLPLREQWAFTRFDAVCHSQGGLLTRMLCSERSSRTLARPFRNELNHYRGRFHRVVTIGSPHNGTRLLRYLLALNRSEFSSFKNRLPLVIGKAGVFLEIAQEKFDPFGVQIRDLNNPSPDSRWKPDPAAKFHLVRTTINAGRPPSHYDEPPAPSYLLLGLLHPLAGPAVLPRGSDGVVDFDSMGAHGPTQPAPGHVFQLPPDLLVSHSPPLDAFGAGAGQTGSPDVGRHVIAALDQNSSAPASDRRFGSFVLPELLDDSIRAQIDHWASTLIFEYVWSAIVEDDGALQRQAQAQQTEAAVLRYALSLPAHLPATNLVVWTVEAFAPGGVASMPSWLSVNPADPRRAAVSIPTNFLGDVVLHASCITTHGAVVLAEPRRIYSASPANATLVGVAVEPDRAALPVGSEVPVELWARYSDGSVIQRHVRPDEITAISSNTGVLIATNSTLWRLAGPGTATVVVTYQGLRATNELTAYIPISQEVQPEMPKLRIIQSSPKNVELSWLPNNPAWVLQQSESLFPASWTNAPSGTNNPAILPAPQTTRFFRLIKQ